MAQTYSSELNGIASNPAVKPAATAYAGRLRRYRATVPLASQVLGAGNEVILALVPPGMTFAFGVLATDTSLSTSTIAIGVSGSTSKYLAAQTLTAVNTPQIFGPVAATTESAHTGQEQVQLLVAVANLPASGNLVVDLYFSTPT